MLSTQDALDRARSLADGARRVLLGVTGPPGGGKSTLAQLLADDLGERARLVPMDGFHLAQNELDRLGRAERKGAPDTFDAGGFAALLRRLRDNREDVIYAPVFRRDIEEPIASGVAVPRSVPLVITEGNYLLLDDGPWAGVGELLDECWFVVTEETLRVERLVARHVAYGREPAAARAWALGPDERNARLIAGTSGRADALVSLD